MTTKRFIRTLAVALTPLIVTLLMLFALPARAATAQDIGSLVGPVFFYGTNSHGYAVSDSGRAVGTCFTNADHFPYWHKSFVTSPNVPIDNTLPYDGLHDHIQGGARSTAWDVWQPVGASNFRAVGEATISGKSGPFWHEEGPQGAGVATRVLTRPPGTCGGIAYSVKGDYATGWGGDCGGGYTRACRWWVGASFEYLSDLGSTYFPNAHSYATDSEGNQTIGYYHQTGGPEQAFFLNGSSGLVPVATPPNTTASAALRIWGQWFVGYYVSNGLTRPIAWQYTGMYQANYVVLALPEGKLQGVARGINNLGQIVGSAYNTPYSFPGTSHDEVACLWNTTGTVTVMNTFLTPAQQSAGWNLVRAYKIASGDHGHAVGIGEFGGGAIKLTHAFRLTDL